MNRFPKIMETIGCFATSIFLTGVIAWALGILNITIQIK